MTETPPETGNRIVDTACAEVADLSQVPLAEHAERLTQAHEAVNSALHHAPLVPRGQ